MDSNALKRTIKLRPFKPFSIHTASGESYRVRHPETILMSVGGNTIVLVTGGETFAMLDLEGITEITFGRGKSSAKKEI